MTRQGRAVCLIYPGPGHLFLSTGIYYAADLSEDHDVCVLLHESDRNAIPESVLKNLERWSITVRWLKDGRRLAKHRYFRLEVARIWSELTPAVLLMNDDAGVFNVYVGREGSRHGVKPVCFQTGSYIGPVTDVFRYQVEVIGAEWAERRDLPRWTGRAVQRAGAWGRHFWHYWLAPMLTGGLPFPGSSSRFVVDCLPCRREGGLFLYFESGVGNALVADGADEACLVPTVHPLMSSRGRRFFDEVSRAEIVRLGIGEPYLLLLIELPAWPAPTHAQHAPAQLVSDGVRRLVDHICRAHPDLPVLLKPHPNMARQQVFNELTAQMSAEYAAVSAIDASLNAVLLLQQATCVIGEASTVMSLARILGDRIVVATHFDEPRSRQPFPDMTGIHFFPFVDGLLEINILQLARCGGDGAIPQEEDKVTMESARQVVSDDEYRVRQ